METITSPRPGEDTTPKTSIDHLIEPTDWSNYQPSPELMNENPIQLSWKSLEYRVKMSTPLAKMIGTITGNRIGRCRNLPQKQILFPMTAYVNPGEVLAVMGPSGSGKTSLLNILAGRVMHSDGDVMANGYVTTKKFKSLSAYVQQDDILNGNLTVYEALLFTALLRIASSDIREKRRRVDLIIEELGLKHCRNTKIGIPGLTKGISGGERKRVSIGVELLTSPSVLFLDEPTSGLDAKTALNIMELILRLSKQNRTIVCTIHQPRSDIYKLFDKLLLLGDGRVAYFGPAKGAVKHFESQGYPMPKAYNPADYFIDLITRETSELTEEQKIKKQEDKKRIVEILDYNEKVSTVTIPKPLKKFSIEDANIPKYSTWWLNEFFILFARSMLNNIRDRILTGARIFQTLTMCIMVGLVYLRIGNNQKSMQNRIGALFFIMINQTMGALFAGLQVFTGEKVVYLRERGSKAFRVGTYYLAKTLSEFAPSIVFPFIFSVISYFMVGFRTDTAGPFFIYVLINIALALTAQAFGFVLSAGTPSQDVASAIAPIIITLLMLFGGFYVNVANIPVYFIWAYYISLFRYAYEALILNEFTNLPLMCDDSELVGPFKICPVTNGNQVIKNLSMNNGNMWIDIATLFALFIALRIFGYLLMRFYQRPKIQR